MERLNHFPGRERPVKATTNEIAGAVAAVIQDRTNKLIADLESRGFAQHYPERFSTLAFAAECLLFQAFPMDVIIAAEFGPHSDAIREHLANNLFEIVASKGLSRRDADEFHRLRETRFAEYIVALRSAGGGQGLERLADVAWDRISEGKARPFTSHFTLFLSTSLAFRFFKGMTTKYEVVR